ncbi:hypothetical protein ACWEDZ_02185 [Streptomyces sp. NPDC005047]
MIELADLPEAEEAPAEIYVVWEHLIGLPGPRYTEKRFAQRMKWRRRAAALDLFEETNGAAVAEMWRLWEKGQPVALVTYLPLEIASHLARRVDFECIPSTRLVVTTPTDMARLIGIVDATHIFHSLPDHALRYGPKGIYVHPHNPGLIGRAI